MKKQYIVILLILFIGLNTQAQTNASMPTDSIAYISLNSYAQPVSFTADNIAQQQDYKHYLKTAKTLKIASWTSLGLGIPTMCIGFLLGASSAHSDSNGGGLTESAGLIFASGAVLTLSSIPLFIVSHHYKKKGNELKKTATLSLGSQQVFVPQGYGFTSSVQPVLSVKIAL